MLLLTAPQLEERRRITGPGGALAPLHASLRAELQEVIHRGFTLPPHKARLATGAMFCPVDGGRLVFDPFSRAAHRCPACRRIHTGELHDNFWATFYQLWLAERAVHASVFATLRGDAECRRLAIAILDAYADHYLSYPNIDNVLGPTRLFFSTYLESIWLLQVCIATDLLEHLGERRLADRVRDRVISPSARLIQSLHEEKSNRQVWNNAALIAAAVVCDRPRVFEQRITGEWGIVQHMNEVLLDDGLWREGENYHQFAIRGLWYGVAIAEAQGFAFDPKALRRFEKGMSATFASQLPDFTLPSRKDSQYAVPLRQWWLAELAELGYARTPTRLLRQVLLRCYDQSAPPGRTARWRSSADSERNDPACRLTRADIGWRGLLFAVESLPEAELESLPSVNFEQQGVAVFRREPDIHVGFEHGQWGGGHGHPDRLNLTLFQGATRWLDDMGTGSYVDKSLRWYRSTLAHNAPLVDGRSQKKTDAALLCYEERGAFGWARARYVHPELGTALVRTIVVGPEYAIDELEVLEWGAASRVELPVHLAGDTALPMSARPLDGGAEPEDGFAFVDQETCVAADVEPWRGVDIGRGDADPRPGSRIAQLAASQPSVLFRARAPGPPTGGELPFYVARLDRSAARAGERTLIRTLLTWESGLEIERNDSTEIVIRSSTERHAHRRVDDQGWHVDFSAAQGRSSIDLGQCRPAPAPVKKPDPEVVLLGFLPTESESSLDLAPNAPVLRIELGKEHYRRSEPSWKQAGAPRARVTIQATRRALIVFADIDAGERVFKPGGAINPYDNDHPDTLGAGAQLYLRCAEGEYWWAAVPEIHSRKTRIRQIKALPTKKEAPLAPPSGTWSPEPRGQGYRIRLELPLPPSLRNGGEFDIDFVINETTVGRERRRGQLSITDVERHWVYLRGDGHGAKEWIRVRLS